MRVKNLWVRNAQCLQPIFAHPTNSLHLLAPIFIVLASLPRALGRGECFAVCTGFRVADCPPWSMRLSLCARDFSRFGKRLEVTKVLNPALLRISVSQRFPRHCDLAQTEFLKHCDHCSPACRCRFKDHFACLIDITTRRAPCNALARFVGQYLRVPFNRLIVLEHHPMGGSVSSPGDAFYLFLPLRPRLNIPPHLIEIRRVCLDDGTGTNPHFSIFILRRRKIVPIQSDCRSAIASPRNRRFIQERHLYPPFLFKFDRERYALRVSLRGFAIFSCMAPLAAPGMAFASMPSSLVFAEAA